MPLRAPTHLLAPMLLLAACSARTTPPDVGPLLDTASPPYVPPDAARPIGRIDVRLAHLSPAGPNLTVCLGTIAGTGVPATIGRILGEPDPAAGRDGTLPYPGVSPYIPLPVYGSPGFGYEVRLYHRDELPFTLAGACPDDGSITPLFAAELEVGPLVAAGTTRVTVAAVGVLPGTPVACAGGCPPPELIVIPDDPTPDPEGVRLRLVHAIPNLPVPIEVCVDPDQLVLMGMNGPMPAMRILPEATDVDGVVFRDHTAFVDLPPLTMAGGITVHAVMMGVPSCFAATQLLGPIPIPLPVPDGTPPDVARVFEAGDVITAFAYGRAGTPCMDDSGCIAALGGRCVRNVCTDALSPGVLPWQDVMGPSM